MRTKDGLGLLGGNLWFDGVSGRILGVLLHELTVSRDGIVHDGLKARAAQIGRHGLGLREARRLDHEKVVGDARNAHVLGSHTTVSMMQLAVTGYVVDAVVDGSRGRYSAALSITMTNTSTTQK